MYNNTFLNVFICESSQPVAVLKYMRFSFHICIKIKNCVATVLVNHLNVFYLRRLCVEFFGWKKRENENRFEHVLLFIIRFVKCLNKSYQVLIFLRFSFQWRLHLQMNVGVCASQSFLFIYHILGKEILYFEQWMNWMVKEFSSQIWCWLHYIETMLTIYYYCCPVDVQCIYNDVDNKEKTILTMKTHKALFWLSIQEKC